MCVCVCVCVWRGLGFKVEGPGRALPCVCMWKGEQGWLLAAALFFFCLQRLSSLSAGLGFRARVCCCFPLLLSSAAFLCCFPLGQCHTQALVMPALALLRCQRSNPTASATRARTHTHIHARTHAHTHMSVCVCVCLMLVGSCPHTHTHTCLCLSVCLSV